MASLYRYVLRTKLHIFTIMCRIFELYRIAITGQNWLKNAGALVRVDTRCRSNVANCKRRYQPRVRLHAR